MSARPKKGTGAATPKVEVEATAAALAKLERKFDNLQGSYRAVKDATAEQGAEIERLSSELSEGEKEREAIAAYAQTANAESARLERRLANLRETHRSVAGEEETQRAEVERLTQALSAAEAKHEALLAEAKESANGEAKDLKRRLANLRETHRSVSDSEAQLNERVKALDAEVEQLQAKAQKLSADGEASEALSKTDAEKIGELKGRIKKLTAENKRADRGAEKLQGLQAKLEEQAASLSETETLLSKAKKERGAQKRSATMANKKVAYKGIRLQGYSFASHVFACFFMGFRSRFVLVFLDLVLRSLSLHPHSSRSCLNDFIFSLT